MDSSRNAQRTQLQAQEREFRETMMRLFAKVRDLKLQVDAIHTSEIFSIAIFKQTQEIEKLAKQLKKLRQDQISRIIGHLRPTKFSD